MGICGTRDRREPGQRGHLQAMATTETSAYPVTSLALSVTAKLLEAEVPGHIMPDSPIYPATTSPILQCA